MQAPVSRSGKTAPLSAALVGTWALLSREDRDSNGALLVEPTLGSDPIALLIYDRAGNFAAQFMKRDRTVVPEDAPAKSAANNSRARAGYDAYFGSYTVDDLHGTVTQRLTGALSSENVGQVLTRAMQVVVDELVIQVDTSGPAGEPLVRTLRWRRLCGS